MSAAVAGSASFQPILGDIKDYLDWNRWMILGLTLWALLVAIVIGSSSNAAASAVLCAPGNVTATPLECTCAYPFPGIVWVAGLVIMGGVVGMETFTDFVDINRTKRKGVFPKEKSVAVMMDGVDDVATEEAVPTVLLACRSARGAIEHAGLQALPPGFSKDQFRALVNNISAEISTAHFKEMVTQRTKREATNAKESIVALLKPSTAFSIGIPTIVQTASLAALHAVQEHITNSVAIALEGGDYDTDAKPKFGAETAALTTKGKAVSPAAAELAKAMTSAIPDDKVLGLVQASVQTAVISKINIVVADLTNIGKRTILYRAVTNFLIFYTIIALTSYNWFPIGKGCFVNWQSENLKAFSLLGIGFLSVILIGVRTTVFDLVDPSAKIQLNNVYN